MASPAFVFLMINILVAFTSGQDGQPSTPNAFQFIASIPEYLMLGDSNNDGIFECQTAERTEVNVEKTEVTYLLKFKGRHGTKVKDVSFHISAGSTPDTFVYTPEDDPSYTEIVKIAYTNFKNCVVDQGKYYDEHCIMYISKDVANDVPAECKKNFEEICGVSSSSNWDDVCGEDA
ncbi:uncharacterized protein LOC119461718 [Dermacentor silvarum]|uniref:uncharacterized protein LOC119461718 n=1 Tax=Dermacentor silvarum TaxID=543639 RepID=UPI0021015E90|nr:uncharacterized protein LOC119461718 [Dermacentor silvarum]